MLRDLVKTTLLVPLFAAAMLGRADAAQLRVLVAGALMGAMETLVPDFEMVTGHKVDVAYDIIERIAARVRKGEAFDLAIESPPQWDALANEGKLDPSVRVQVASVKWGLYVRKGESKPDISSVEALRQALLNARSIAYSTSQGPIQAYQARVTDQLGLTEALKLKAKYSRAARPGEAGVTFEVVINGEADLGFGTISEILARPALDLVGPVPSEVQSKMAYVTVLPVDAKEAAAAKAFVEFLVSPRARSVISAAGLDPD
jgi:molybdate transport system substrate-binding protein